MKLSFLCLFFVFVSYGQKARFSADSANYEGYFGPLNWEWKINNKKFTFGSKSVKIPINLSTSFDTINFRENDTSQWMKILCKINSLNSYVFTYNECCGGFYLTQKDKGIINGSLKIKLSDKTCNKTFTIEFGDRSYLLDSTNNKLLINPIHGVMDSNIYWFKMYEIDVHNQKKEIIVDSLFVPLSEVPVSIEIDAYNSILTVK